MVKLQFDSQSNYTFLEEIYTNEYTGTSFNIGFDEVNRRKVGIKTIDLKLNSYDIAMREIRTINNFANLTTKIPVIYNNYLDKKNNKLYIIMQLIEGGETLRSYLNKKVPISNSIEIIKNLCEVLSVFHSKGYYHRDLKPDNIMVRQKEVFLIDFNLTNAPNRKGEGTAGYKSPDQELGFPTVDNPDVFSLGVILYEIACGERPIPYKDYSISTDRTGWSMFVEPKEKNENIKVELNDIIVKAMSVTKGVRYRNARELGRDLMSYGKRNR